MDIFHSHNISQYLPSHQPINPNSNPQSPLPITYPTLTQLTHYTPLSYLTIFHTPLTPISHQSNVHLYRISTLSVLFITHHNTYETYIPIIKLHSHNRQYNTTHTPSYRTYIHLTPINSNQLHNPYHSTSQTAPLITLLITSLWPHTITNNITYPR